MLRRQYFHRLSVFIVFGWALQACSGAGMVNGATGGAPSDLTQAAPTQASGVSSPYVEKGDHNEKAMTAKGSYPIDSVTTNSEENSPEVEIVLRGNVTCRSGTSFVTCGNGRVLRMVHSPVLRGGETVESTGKNPDFVDVVLAEDPNQSEHGYFEIKVKVPANDLVADEPFEGHHLFAFGLFPENAPAPTSSDKQACHATNVEGCFTEDTQALHWVWESPVPRKTTATLTMPNIANLPLKIPQP